MAGADVEDAGAEATCPRCGATVKLHSMIPVLPSAAAAGGPERICVACARAPLPVPPAAISAGDATALGHASA